MGMGRTGVVYGGFVGRRLRGNGEGLCGCWKAEGCVEEKWWGSGIVDREVGVRQSRVVGVMWN